MRSLALVALTFPTLLAGQQPSSGQSAAATSPITAAFKFSANRYAGWLATAFDSIPAASYGYRPTPVQQSIGYIAQHLEDANNALCDRFGAAKHRATAEDALPDTVKAKWPKETLVTRLRASFAYCDSAMARLTDADLDKPVPFGPPGSGLSARPARSLVLFVTDLAEHYAQLSGYMRLLGLVPPSALPPKARTAIVLPAASLARFVGTYDLPASAVQELPALVLEVTMKDDGLYLRPTGRSPARLWPESPTDFFVKEVDAQVTFVVGPRGEVTGVVVHQFGEERTAKKR